MRLADIRERVKFRAADRSPTKSELTGAINDQLREIFSRHDFSSLVRVHRFRLWPKISGASIASWTCVQNSRAVTVGGGMDQVPSTGKLVSLNDRVYRLSEQHSSTKRFLDVPFLDAGGSYAPEVFFDEVALPLGCSKLLGYRLLEGTGSRQWVRPVTRAELFEQDPTATGTPTMGAVISKRPLPRPHRAMPAPTNAGSGNGPLTNIGGSATFRYWYSHVDRYTGAESALSPYVEVTVNTVYSWSVTITELTHTREEFDIRIYRSRANGSRPYLHSDLAPSASFVDDIRDENLGGPADESGSTMYLRFHPIPDTAKIGEAMYRLGVPQLSEDDDRAPLDADDIPTLIHGVRAQLAERYGDLAVHDRAQARFELGVKRMIRRDRLNASVRPVKGRRTLPPLDRRGPRRGGDAIQVFDERWK